VPPSPSTFVLTPDEAAALQALQSARQARFARQGTKLRLAVVLVPVTALVALFAADRIVFGGNMPFGIYLGLIAAYLFGSFTQGFVVKMSVSDTKRRMLLETPQVWEPGTVTITGEGLRQVAESSEVLWTWSAIGPIKRASAMLLLWLGRFSVVAVPLRAFETESDAAAFEAEARCLVEYHAAAR
jgi:hypothetical protein